MSGVLIVDDSPTYRALIRRALTDEADIEVLGSARDGQQALESIAHFKPDILTLDLEMQVLDGLATLEQIKLRAQKEPAFAHVRVIVISAHTLDSADMTIRAFHLGAHEVVAKATGEDAEANFAHLKEQLLSKIHGLTFSHEGVKIATISDHSKCTNKFSAILIGSSTGGPQALAKVLPGICEASSLPILLVQHMPPVFTRSLAQSLDRVCSHTVLEVDDELEIMPKTVYIAPGGRHMTVAKNTSGRPVTRLNDQPPENHCRPAVDVLFRSAAEVYGGDVLAIILTGMGSDGTKGLAPLKRKGACVIAQDQASSVVWGMPGSAVKAGLVDQVVPLSEIPSRLAAHWGRQVSSKTI